VDVRPALDTPGALVDRTRMAIYERFAAWGLPCPITGQSGGLASAAAAAAQQAGQAAPQQQR
jgi:cytochrome c heme-lyase